MARNERITVASRKSGTTSARSSTTSVRNTTREHERRDHLQVAARRVLEVERARRAVGRRARAGRAAARRAGRGSPRTRSSAGAAYGLSANTIESVAARPSSSGAPVVGDGRDARHGADRARHDRDVRRASSGPSVALDDHRRRAERARREAGQQRRRRRASRRSRSRNDVERCSRCTLVERRARRCSAEHDARPPPSQARRPARGRGGRSARQSACRPRRAPASARAARRPAARARRAAPAAASGSRRRTIAIPIALTGPSVRLIPRSPASIASSAAITVRPLAIIAGRRERQRRARRASRDVPARAQRRAVARDEQQAVVGARAEHEHGQQRRRGAVDREPGLGEQVDHAGRDRRTRSRRSSAARARASASGRRRAAARARAARSRAGACVGLLHRRVEVAREARACR